MDPVAQWCGIPPPALDSGSENRLSSLLKKNLHAKLRVDYTCSMTPSLLCHFTEEEGCSARYRIEANFSLGKKANKPTNTLNLPTYTHTHTQPFILLAPNATQSRLPVGVRARAYTQFIHLLPLSLSLFLPSFAFPRHLPSSPPLYQGTNTDPPHTCQDGMALRGSFLV